jgi:hypothetical protein
VAHKTRYGAKVGDPTPKNERKNFAASAEAKGRRKLSSSPSREAPCQKREVCSMEAYDQDVTILLKTCKIWNNNSSVHSISPFVAHLAVTELILRVPD